MFFLYKNPVPRVKPGAGFQEPNKTRFLKTRLQSGIKQGDKPPERESTMESTEIINTTNTEETMNTTEKKGETKMNTTEKKSSLNENIKQANETLKGNVKALVELLNAPASEGDKYNMMQTRIESKRVTVNKCLNELNKLIALQYYKKTDMFDIIKNGDKVPAKILNETVDGTTYKIEVKNTTVYPTLSGMKNAGIIDSEVLARVDALRRIAAYVKSGCTASEYLTGDKENKKDIPSKETTAIIENMGDISKNKARSIMTRVFKDLTGETYKKDVLPKLYDEFEGYITKRSTKWGNRAIVGKATACDMVLEFAWMYFNNKTAFKYIAE